MVIRNTKTAQKMHCNSDKFTERENRTCDGLPDRLRAIAADELEGRQPVLSPANSHDLLAAADEIERLRTAIRRLAEQDATLSVCDGNVTVTMDATLTDEEREAVSWVCGYVADITGPVEDTLRGLLERHSNT